MAPSLLVIDQLSDAYFFFGGLQFANIRHFAGGTKGLNYAEVARCTGNACAITGSFLESNGNGAKRNTQSSELEVRADPAHRPWTQKLLKAARAEVGERDRCAYGLPG